ncbi:MAG: hypothetical protein JJT94_00855, partial [Bernardetiaceae bacterium]|nr:hypothetical protein [Bernardetiaceae bacterium]
MPLILATATTSNNDNAIIFFAKHFYSNLIYGDSIAEAYARASNYIKFQAMREGYNITHIGNVVRSFYQSKLILSELNEHTSFPWALYKYDKNIKPGDITLASLYIKHKQSLNIKLKTATQSKPQELAAAITLPERQQELAALDSFYQNMPDKKIFAFYGMAQMGKSMIIYKWLNRKKNNTIYYIRLDIQKNLWSHLINKIFGIQNNLKTYDKDDFKIFLLIDEIKIKDSIIYFENIESELLLQNNVYTHKLQADLYELLEMLSAIKGVKIILESQYEIDFENLIHQVAFLPTQQLKAHASIYYENHYLALGFTL